MQHHLMADKPIQNTRGANGDRNGKIRHWRREYENESCKLEIGNLKRRSEFKNEQITTNTLEVVIGNKSLEQ